MTKEETFLMKLYTLSMKEGNPYEAIDRYVIGNALGYGFRGVDTIVRILTQTNFIKKGEGDKVFVTDHGLKLISILQGKK